MDVESFTQAAEVRDLIQKLKEDCKDKEFSDVIDDDGNQYVDLVMEGGGILGIALVGYTYVLEEMGLRFLRIGGTSAGSINALLLAALGTPGEPKSEKVVKQLANLDVYSFVDGGPGVRDVIEGFIQKAGKWKMLWKVFKARNELKEAYRNLGLNPGEVFRKWLSDALQKEGVDSARKLGERMRALPQSLRRRHDPEPVFERDDFRLALVAADISTETKVVFPKMAPLYWKDTDGVNPALFVRASMSVPFFFRPLHVEDIPQGEAAQKNWEKLAGYEEDLPTECMFVDGGIMSNFPIDLFHRPIRVPAAPTFGVKLGTDQRKHQKIENAAKLVFPIFDSARHTLDYDFITRNPDYNNLVEHIDTGYHNWINFDVPEEDKIDLFVRGAKAADEFLRRFDWEDYKEIRRRIARQFEDHPTT